MPVGFDADFTLTINGNGVAGAASFDVLNPALPPSSSAPPCWPAAWLS
jgi:hypothetical protein